MVETVRTKPNIGPRTVPQTVQRAVGRARAVAARLPGTVPRSESRGPVRPGDLRAVRGTGLLVDGDEARGARRRARALGLPRTFDDTSAWAALGALSVLVRLADDGSRSAIVVDRGAPRSLFARWADAVGFAPVDIDVTDPDPSGRSVESGSVDFIAQLHPDSATSESVDADLAASCDALRYGGLVTVTVRLGPPDDAAMSIADVRSLIARAAEQGLSLVGDLDLEDSRRARNVQSVETASFGLAMLTFRRR